MLLSFINSKKPGVGLDSIIDYLDYVNRVTYSEEELMKLLDQLCQDKKIFKSGKQYFGLSSASK